MGVFHPEYTFELRQVHIWIELLEFWRGSIFFKLGAPVFGVSRRQSTSYRAPFRDAKATLLLERREVRKLYEWTYPDSVSRVKPPSMTIPKTLAALPKSQYATVLSLVSGKLSKISLILWLILDSGDGLRNAVVATE